MDRILILAERFKELYHKEVIFCLTRLKTTAENSEKNSEIRLHCEEIRTAICKIGGVLDVHFKDYTIIVTVGRAFDAYEIKKEVIKVLKKKVFSDAENVEVWIEYETGDEPLKISDYIY